MKGASIKLRAMALACAIALSSGAIGVGWAFAAGAGDNSALGETSAESFEEQTFEEVTFGTYEQDGNNSNGAEDIVWYVLDEQDGSKLLVSKFVLDARAYDDKAKNVKWYESSPRPQFDVEWADSSVRSWLNGEFAKTAFGDKQSAIKETKNTDTKNNATHTAATAADPSIHVAAESDDQVFLLSVAEAKAYFHNNAARAAKPTEYALAQGVYTGIATDASGQVDEGNSGNAIWWLRTNGYYSGYNAVVTDDGYVHGAGYRSSGELHDGFKDHGSNASPLGGNVGIRPAIWVETSALS